MAELLEPLRYSVEQLRSLVAPLSPEQLRMSAYPKEWTIADVLSHLGSGAVIFVQGIDTAVTGDPAPAEFNQSVWSEWDAKSPEAQWADLPAADAAVIARLSALSPEERARVKVSLGPFELDYDAFAGLRLSEHAFHTWDVDVALNPAAVLPPEVVDSLLGVLEMIARFAAKPTGSTRTYVVRTENPVRTYRIELTPESATVTEGAGEEPADVQLPAEAFLRLVYGRLDPEHTPADIEGVEHLDELRSAFPGF
jgi:uncharacterized protein (TIGR03083 family)